MSKKQKNKKTKKVTRRDRTESKREETVHWYDKTAPTLVSSNTKKEISFNF